MKRLARLLKAFNPWRKCRKWERFVREWNPIVLEDKDLDRFAMDYYNIIRPENMGDSEFREYLVERIRTRDGYKCTY